MYSITRIKHEMALRFWTARRLAEEAKVSEATVLRILAERPKGRPHPETIKKLAVALKLKPKDVALSVEQIEILEAQRPEVVTRKLG